MKKCLIFAALLSLFATTGCYHNIVNLKEQVSPTYHVLDVDVEKAAVYDASIAALTQMGYKITASGSAKGKIEAISNISAADPQRPARQTTANVRFNLAPYSGTRIEILFTEIQEEPLNRREGMGTKQPLSSSPLYSVFAKYVEDAVKSKVTPVPQP